MTFTEFLENAASKREFVNLFFEQRVFELIGTFQRLSTPLERSGVPYQLVGGLAVFLHVENADPTHSSITGDIDVMIRREDLSRVVAIAEENGFRLRQAAETRIPVRLICAGENGDIRPVRAGLHGQEFWVIPVPDLVRMKLTSYRDKDRVHIRGMDAAGLITKEVADSLSAELRHRLRNVRESE